MTYEVKVLDHGFVKLRNLAGPTRRMWTVRGGETATFEFDADDTDPANAARMSFDAMDSELITLKDGTTRPRTVEDDYKLNEYLLVNEHASPFEMIVVWMELKVPIFIDRQFVRHGTIRRNESSGRYIVLPAEWYIPEIVGGKAPNKKQGQEDNLPQRVQDGFKFELNSQCELSYGKYLHYLGEGVAPEHARMFLHVNHYVHYIAKVDLRNLFHFLRLRAHSHAQVEARKYAEAIIELLRPHLPQLMGLFDKHVRRA